MPLEETYVFVDLPALGFVPAGLLAMDVQSERIHSCTFRYGMRYAKRPDAIALDPFLLPLPRADGGLGPEMDLLTNGDFGGAIRDASPDAYGRGIMARAARVASLNEFQYLVGSGEHRVGALAFGTAPDRPPTRRTFWEDDAELPETLDLDALLCGHDAAERDEVTSRAFLDFVDRAVSLGGARPKAAATLGGRHWLSKFPKAGETYDSMKAEAAVMRMASELGFTVPDVRLEKVGNRDVFLIERFDRKVSPDGSVALRMPFASAMSMTGETEATARWGSYEAIVKAMRQVGTRVAEDARDLFRRAAFNVLVGNDDDHLRNHGFLYDHASRGWNLSPLYDVSPRPMLSSRRNLAISFLADTDLREANVGNVVACAGVFGIGGEEAKAIVSDMAGYVSANWEGYLKGTGMKAADVERMAGCFAQAGACALIDVNRADAVRVPAGASRRS